MLLKSKPIFKLTLLVICLGVMTHATLPASISTTSKRIIGWGSNYYKQINPTSSQSYIETPVISDQVSGKFLFETITVGAGTVLGINPDGEVYCWGRSYSYVCGVDARQIDTPKRISGFPSELRVQAAHPTGSGSVFIMSDGSLYGTGPVAAFNGEPPSGTPKKINFTDESVFIRRVANGGEVNTFIAIDSENQA
eukprot:gb/GECH01006527.1/.p1 GENE.gb/GECH01006527.1/~~gb/GECH01006527.1/.p1  ORF type:complete len:195 (+),score=6.84 gb/GECH01006527.1/:1-585(+)